MNALATMEFDGMPFRSVELDGAPWFVANDVCEALGLDPTQTRKLDEDEKGLYLIQTLRGDQNMVIITESGLYTLMLRCRDAMKPGTKPHRFRKWVTGEVLPRLRRGESVSIMPHDEAPAPALESDILPMMTTPDAVERARVAVSLIRECRAVMGRTAAMKMWRELGLPDPGVNKIGKTPQEEARDERRARQLAMFDAMTFRPPEPGIHEWAQARLVSGGKGLKVSDLHADYLRWLAGQAFRAVSLTTFGRDLRKLGYLPEPSDGMRLKGYSLAT